MLQAASLIGVKNQSLLLQILAHVRQAEPGARLILAGDGPLAGALRRQAADLGLNDAVDWRGQLPFAAMAAIHSQAQFYIQTSLHEAQGMAVLESLAGGRPVLGTPVGVLPEVAAAPAGWDAAALAAQVVGLWRDPDAYAAAAAAARDQAANYSLERSTATFAAIYGELVPDHD